MYPQPLVVLSSDNDKAQNGVSRERSAVSPPMPIRVQRSSGWHPATLQVPELQEAIPEKMMQTAAPVPPPRKKKLRLRQQQQQEQQQTGGRCSLSPPPCFSSPFLLKPRPKNLSTVSLPNYNELNVVEVSTETRLKPPGLNLSSHSLGTDNSLKSLKEATAERLESYMRKCRSFGSFLPEQLIDKINQTQDEADDSDDSWGGLDDWDLGVIEHDVAQDTEPPITPTSKLPRRRRNGHAGVAQRVSLPVPPPAGFESNADFIARSPSPADRPPEAQGIDIPETQGNSFLDSSNNEDWFDNHTSPRGSVKNAGKDATNQNKSDEQQDNFKVFLYDFDKFARSPARSMTDLTAVDDMRVTMDSVTPPPSPEAKTDTEDVFHQKTTSVPPTGNDSDATVTHSKLLRLLKELQTSEGGVKDSDAQHVLRSIGLPLSLRDENDKKIIGREDLVAVHGAVVSNIYTEKENRLNKPGNGSDSSGRSSMTPSLSELETALSELLEASAAAGGVEQDEQTLPPVPTIKVSVAPA